jgi:hypothetical protein
MTLPTLSLGYKAIAGYGADAGSTITTAFQFKSL